MYWVRDWVFRVIAPFLAQLKNRLNNIRVEDGKFYNSENRPVSIRYDVYYSHHTASNDYGQENGSKPFTFESLSATDRGLEISSDRKAFRVLKDSIIDITIFEGVYVKHDSTISIKLLPLSGESKDDYLNTFNIKPNSEPAASNMYKKYIFMNCQGWTSARFEWNNVFVKADQWVTFKIEGIKDNDSGLDGGVFGYITIKGGVV